MHSKAPITDKISTYALLKRPDITLEDINNLTNLNIQLDEEWQEKLLIEIKYEGYIDKAYKEAKKYYKWKIVKSQRILITMLFPI